MASVPRTSVFRRSVRPPRRWMMSLLCHERPPIHTGDFNFMHHSASKILA